MNKIRKSLIILSIILFFGKVGYCDEGLEISVTHPWLALLASFIGGPEVHVKPVRIWNNDGDLVLNEKGKILRELEQGAKIISLDENDAVATGIKQQNYNVKYLYNPFPVKMTDLFDPSVIPFVAQRILTVLSEWDSQNYPYYQRRLAEFQARLSGSILVGQVLKDVTVSDLGGSCGILLRAAGCKIEKPEAEILDDWKKLREYIELKHSEGITIVYDDDTPKAIKKYLSGKNQQKFAYHWERPDIERDYPTFLHEQYISLWQKIIAK